MEKPKDIEKIAKNPTKGRVKSLYALPYKGCMVYLLQIDGDIFMSLSVINGQIFQFYLEMTPSSGRKTLSNDEVDKTIQILLAGAHTTIEQQLGIEQSDKEAGQAAEVIKVAEDAFGDKPKEDRIIN